MLLRRFQYLLDAYGADLGRWPEAERQAAQVLLAASPEAARAQREAALLDHALRQAGSTSAPGERVQSIVERALAAAEVTPQPAAPESAWPVSAGYRWAPTALFGSMAVLGFLIGLADLRRDVAPAVQAGLVNGVFTADPAAGLGL